MIITEKIKNVAKDSLWLFLVFLLPLPLSVIVLKNLGGIIFFFGEKEFGEIFSALYNAEIIPPFVLSAVLSVCAALLTSFSAKRNKVLAYVLVVLLWLLLLIAAILFSKVNSVKFIDVAVSLINNFKNGLAEAM